MLHFLRFSGKVKNTNIVETPTGPSLKQTENSKLRLI